MEDRYIKESLFDGEYSNILKSISISNSYLAKTCIESYLKDFELSGIKRQIIAIEAFASGSENIKYEDDGYVLRVIKEIFESKKSSMLESKKFLISSNDALIYGDFVRFIFALYFGNYSEELKFLSGKIYSLIPDISRSAVSSYKEENNKSEKIKFFIASSIYRNILDILFDFSEMVEDAFSKADVMYYKTFITCAVMPDYRALIGPDMIKTACCFEDIGKTEEAKKMYEAVTGDFECMLSGHYKKEEAEEDYVSLVSLWQSYDSLNRLEGSDRYIDKMQIVENIIKKL